VRDLRGWLCDARPLVVDANRVLLDSQLRDAASIGCFIDDAVELVLRAALAAEGDGRVLNAGAQKPEWQLEIVPLPPTPGSPLRRAPI
jgi:hypothetical protein